MPIYQFQCDNCGHEFEAIMRVDSTWVEACPRCNQHSVKKIIGRSNFQLKGSGWYETDFKNSKPKPDSNS